MEELKLMTNEIIGTTIKVYRPHRCKGCGKFFEFDLENVDATKYSVECLKLICPWCEGSEDVYANASIRPGDRILRCD